MFALLPGRRYPRSLDRTSRLLHAPAQTSALLQKQVFQKQRHLAAGPT